MQSMPCGCRLQAKTVTFCKLCFLKGHTDTVITHASKTKLLYIKAIRAPAGCRHVHECMSSPCNCTTTLLQHACPNPRNAQYAQTKDYKSEQCIHITLRFRTNFLPQIAAPPFSCCLQFAAPLHACARMRSPLHHVPRCSVGYPRLCPKLREWLQSKGPLPLLPSPAQRQR